MHVWITGRGRRPPTGKPSPLLEYLADGYAHRIAGLWPEPHAAFITAPAERRHLVCLALARAGDGGALPCAGDAILDLPLKQAVAAAVPESPDGLRRALGRLGERAWSPPDYDRLLHVLALGSKSVRHADAVTSELVVALASLPEPLVRARVGGFGLTGAQARLLAEAFAIIQARYGQDAAGAAARRWAGAATAEDLFEMVQDDILPPMPSPPFAGTERLRPLASKAAISEAARDYRNCLRSRIPEVCRGEAAVYEWLGPPGVIVELGRDPLFGWVLSEARLAGNADVPERDRTAILAELERIGVHIGRNSWALRGMLGRAHDRGWTYTEPQRETQWMFAD